jgi:hypothetical protein
LKAGICAVGTAVADHRGGGVLAQAREVLRQQRRAHQAEAVGAVAFGAVLAVELGRRLGGEGRQSQQQRQQAAHSGARPDFMRCRFPRR